jgi:glycosyltransferase involved in cell wall biosynthesis
MANCENGNCLPHPIAPFRIGIWCDYESPVLPDEGIGVLVYNLIQGFLRLEEPLEVVLLVSPGDQKKVASFTGQHARLRIMSKLDGMPAWWTWLRGFLKWWVRWSDRLHRRKNSSSEGTGRFQERIRHYLGTGLKSWAGWIAPIKLLASVAAVFVFPVLGVLLWACYAIVRYARATIDILTLPIRKLDQGSRSLNRFFSSKEPSSMEAAHLAGCDAWIVPQVLLNHSLPSGSVVLIHDFASSHFQEQFEKWYPGYHERAARLIPLRAREAAICACMSNFIRDTDLLGVLKLAPSKVRVIRSAPPADLPDLDVASESLIPKYLKRPFLFFPTAFRPYKNHGGLIEALRILRDHHHENTWDLVFTGEQPAYLPPELEKRVQECELEDCVHVLGRVDRKTLAALYHRAFATLVPSFYEQGSFQIYEALQAGSPVACSRIPPFLEQCGAMGNGMLYFDPADPEAIARTILAIRDDREEIRRRQWQASRVLWTRTWDHVARDFLQVCKEVTSIDLRRSA